MKNVTKVLRSSRSLAALTPLNLVFSVQSFGRQCCTMAPPEVTLYTVPGSCAIVPHILLHRTGMPFKLAPILRKDLTGEFAKINPKMQVPALNVDGALITENPAIAHRINQLAPDAHVMGDDPMQFIRVCEWLN